MIFLFGTLRYVPLLNLVLGREIAAPEMRTAELPGHSVRRARGAEFPLLQAMPDEAAEGLLIGPLSAVEIDRLSYYEGVFGYALNPCRVNLPGGDSETARVFRPYPDSRWRPGPPWSLDRWSADWGALTLLAADEVMDFHGRMSAAIIAPSFAAIRMRAAHRLAATGRPGSREHDVAQDVDVARRHRAHVNYFGFEETELRHRQYDGSMGPLLNRAALMTGQAAVVLPYDPALDLVLLVEQFRTPVYLIGDPAPWMLEPVAGMVDPGETPETAARREAGEEAGLRLDRLEEAGKAYSSSGSSSEFLHLYVGIAPLGETGGSGGLASEGEDIRSLTMPFGELMDRVDAQTVKDLPLIAIANWLARHRDRLRSGR